MNQGLLSQQSLMKLHIGCFDQPLEGWYNTDITPHITVSRIPYAADLLHAIGKLPDHRLSQHKQGVFKNVHYLDVRKRFPFQDNSVNAVFSSHIIEHLYQKDARHMLQESLRILSPGSVCRIVAPSLEWALSLYDEENPEATVKAILENDHANPKNCHQWMYTGKSLVKLMHEIGFTDVESLSFKHGRLPDLERIDNRPENSIYVEGIKPEN